MDSLTKLNLFTKSKVFNFSEEKILLVENLFWIFSLYFIAKFKINLELIFLAYVNKKKSSKKNIKEC